MSPDIYRDKKLIASVPDETGVHSALDGSPLWISLNGIEARNKKQIVLLEGTSVGGSRIVGLTQEGLGNSGRKKKGGDGKDPEIGVVLHDRPIRVSYSERIEIFKALSPSAHRTDYVGTRQTRYNPRWSRR